MATGMVLVIFAAVLCGVSGVFFLASPEAHSELAPALLSFGAACGFVGVKIP